MNIYDVINSIAGFQLFFIAFYLFFRNDKMLHTKLIALFLFAKSIVYIHAVLVGILHLGWFVSTPLLKGLSHSTMYLLHPIIYLYVLSHLDLRFKLRPVHMLHSVPFFFMLIHYYFPDWIPQSKNILRYIVQVIFLIQLVIYYTLSIIHVFRHQKNYKGNEKEESKILWLKIVLISLLILWISFSFNNIYKLIEGAYIDGMFIYIEFVFFAILIGLIYTGLHFGSVFNITSLQKKYNYSKLSEREKQVYTLNLDNYMTSNKLYLDPEITLDKLAKQINISKRDLSQVINEEKQMNFNEYVNSFRLNRSIELLGDKHKNKKTIQEILYDSGFNSKSVFYEIFNKHTGMSPSQYANQQKKGS